MSDDIQIQAGPILQTKLAPNGDGAIEGWLVRYNEIDSDAETIAYGAFGESIRETKAAGVKVPLLWQHDMRTPIGSWSDLSETPEGVYGRARINTDVAKGREALSLVQRGDLSGLSVGFASAVRRGATILSGKLMEGSLVSIPSAPKARIKLKECSTVPELVDALVAGRVGRRDVELVVRKSWAAISGSPDEPDPKQREALARLDERIAAATKALKGM
jgi:HK97 family phage prohead protease